MLTRIGIRGLLAFLVYSAYLAALPAPAVAQGSVVCAERDPATQECLLELAVTLNGDPPTVTASVSGGGTGYQVTCDRGPHYNPDPEAAHLREVPCNIGEYGWYSQTYDCYFMLAGHIPPDSDGVILPGGYQSGDPGAVYQAMCYTPSHPDIPTDNYCFYCVAPGWNFPAQLVFLTSEPDGFDGTPDPVPDLLVSAIDELQLTGPTIGSAPPAGQGAGLVRLPVWLWNEVSPNNWGTPSQTVGPIAGISVVAQAEATGIEWSMGDGTTVQCDEGVAWQRGMSVLEPPCGHTYLRASRYQPGGVYEISATTTWQLEWFTEGLPEPRGGEFELQATSTASIQIDEIQVLTGR